jgi:hypothetical protein
MVSLKITINILWLKHRRRIVGTPDAVFILLFCRSWRTGQIVRQHITMLETASTVWRRLWERWIVSCKKNKSGMVTCDHIYAFIKDLHPHTTTSRGCKFLSAKTWNNTQTRRRTAIDPNSTRIILTAPPRHLHSTIPNRYW